MEFSLALFVTVVFFALMSVCAADCTGVPKVNCSTYNESAGMCESVAACNWVFNASRCVQDPLGCDAWDRDRDKCSTVVGCQWKLSRLNSVEIIGIIFGSLVVLTIVLAVVKFSLDHHRSVHRKPRFSLLAQPVTNASLESYQPPQGMGTGTV